MCHRSLQQHRSVTHFGVSVAMDDHRQRVVGCVPNPHAVRSKLEQHLVCQTQTQKQACEHGLGAMAMDV